MSDSIRTAAVDQSDAITSADIVDALIAIRDELVAGMKPAFVIPAIWKLVGRIERDADLATEQKMDQLVRDLAGSLPAIRGGGPDDFEIVDSAIYGDEWPAYPDADVDGYAWAPTFDGPTPDHILAAEYDAHTDAHDWDAYAALDVTGISEADHVVATGCC